MAGSLCLERRNLRRGEKEDEEERRRRAGGGTKEKQQQGGRESESVVSGDSICADPSDAAVGELQ